MKSNFLFGVSLSMSLFLSILFYIINSLSYQTISRNRGYNKPWIAWIPFASDYLKGAIADDISRKKNKYTRYRIAMLVFGLIVALTIISFGILLIYIVLSAQQQNGLDLYNNSNSADSATNSPLVLIIQLMPFILISLASIVYTIIMYIVLYKTFKDYVPSNAVLFLLLSIFIPATYPFLLLSIKNKPAVSIYGSRDTGPKWNWAPPQQPYGTTPPPYYGQGNAVPPIADNQQNNWNPSGEPPKDDQDKPQQ